MAVLGIGNAAALVGSAVTDGTTHASNVGAYGKWQVGVEEGVKYLYHAEVDPSDTDALFVSPAIKGSWVNGQKITVGFNISTLGANVAAPFELQGSFDGKTWKKLNVGAGTGGAFSDDVEPNVVDLHVYTADLSNYNLQWYRLAEGTVGASEDQTNIKFNFIVSGLNPALEDALVLEDTTNTLVGGTGVAGGGIGPDPS